MKPAFYTFEIMTSNGRIDELVHRTYKGFLKNAPGAFYVEDGCCTSCMAPHAEAPELMGYDDEASHCYFKRQPVTQRETTHALRAVWSSEFVCLRYAGDDPDILRRLAEASMASACDRPLSGDFHPILRTHVTFQIAAVSYNSIREAATSFRNYFESLRNEYQHFRASDLNQVDQGFRFTCGWSSEELNVTVSQGEAGTDRVLISHSPVPKMGSRSLSFILDDWLQSDPRFANFRWYTPDSWHKGIDVWQDSPI